MDIKECSFCYHGVAEESNISGMVIFLDGYFPFGEDLADIFVPILKQNMSDCFFCP